MSWLYEMLEIVEMNIFNRNRISRWFDRRDGVSGRHEVRGRSLLQRAGRHGQLQGRPDPGSKEDQRKTHRKQTYI